MASGKTTFGRAAAAQLGWDFADLDEVIAGRYGTPTEIFAAHGEAYFRELETSLLQEALQSGRDTILALGGGTLLREENLRLVKARATIIWLDTDFDIILSEIGNAERPLVRGKSVADIRALYETRRPFYETAADIAFPVVSRDYLQVIADLVLCIRSIQTFPKTAENNE